MQWSGLYKEWLISVIIWYHLVGILFNPEKDIETNRDATNWEELIVFYNFQLWFPRQRRKYWYSFKTSSYGSRDRGGGHRSGEPWQKNGRGTARSQAPRIHWNIFIFWQVFLLFVSKIFEHLNIKKILFSCLLKGTGVGQYGKISLRYHSFTYHKGSFEHKLFNY